MSPLLCFALSWFDAPIVPGHWNHKRKFYECAISLMHASGWVGLLEPDELITGVKQLRVVCNACHAAYLKTQ
jgi:hypothetical protein